MTTAETKQQLIAETSNDLARKLYAGMEGSLSVAHRRDGTPFLSFFGEEDRCPFCGEPMYGDPICPGCGAT